MLSQEPRSSENISAITPQEPTRYQERRNDDEPNQDRLETARNVTKKDEGNTEASSAESSVQNPPSSSKECIIKRFWSKQVSVVVEFETCRDHLAIERTFLGYLRTSLATAVLGTVVAQLFALQASDTGFGYTAVGKPLATLCYSFSICIVLLGAFRAWRLQHAMFAGKALAGGFELTTLALGFLILSLVFFGFLIALDVVKESSS
ncbi:hypothetical protein JMJ77_0004241 [Colletotrichum scovillei]|uniref:DUF202 domain-containing protein n=2 Tax=Colletotrichum acutatum species complex TaxID=2707335 RepID=A0A9P7QWN2_9PEZI|nr:hypothetical protein JMJ77_0004241 [Colletotrichum scovillei]KAG7064233.1 hypothetical protein JMJ76_0007280 [Colletotrichum scovillei]